MNWHHSGGGGGAAALIEPNVLACGPVPARTAGLPKPWRASWQVARSLLGGIGPQADTTVPARLAYPDMGAQAGGGTNAVAHVRLKAATVTRIALQDVLVMSQRAPTFNGERAQSVAVI